MAPKKKEAEPEPVILGRFKSHLKASDSVRTCPIPAEEHEEDAAVRRASEISVLGCIVPAHDAFADRHFGAEGALWERAAGVTGGRRASSRGCWVWAREIPALSGSARNMSLSVSIWLPWGKRRALATQEHGTKTCLSVADRHRGSPQRGQVYALQLSV